MTRTHKRTQKRYRGGGGMWDTFKSNLTGALGTARSYLPTWGKKVSGDCTAADGKLANIERKIQSIQEEVTAARNIIKQAKESVETAAVAAGPAAPMPMEPAAPGDNVPAVPQNGGGRRRRRKRTRKNRRKRTRRQRRKNKRRTRR